MNLEKKIGQISITPSDINQHIPTLLRYAKECEHITEMGVREGVSLWAFLGGLPKRLVAYDFQKCSTIQEFYKAAEEHNISFEFIQKNVLEVKIEETDLLFLDTWHCYMQLKAELKLHANKANKYIILHDTTTYETTDETQYEKHFNMKVNNKGLWPAVTEFLEENKSWKLKERFTNNNGLTILEKIL